MCRVRHTATLCKHVMLRRTYIILDTTSMPHATLYLRHGQLNRLCAQVWLKIRFVKRMCKVKLETTRDFELICIQFINLTYRKSNRKPIAHISFKYLTITFDKEENDFVSYCIYLITIPLIGGSAKHLIRAAECPQLQYLVRFIRFRNCINSQAKHFLKQCNST